MSIIRTIHNRENPYAQLCKATINDPNLSLTALGLWALAMSKPNHWKFYIKQIYETRKEGRDAIYNAINELIAAGYCYRHQKKQKNELGRYIFASIEYIFFEHKPTEQELEDFKIMFSQTPFPETEVADTKNPPLVNTEDYTYPNTSLDKENKQQQRQKCPPTPKGAAAAPFAAKEEKEIYPSLKELPIDEEEKRWITERYCEAVVDDAVAYAIHPLTKISKSLVQALKWACKENKKPPAAPIDVESKNKAFATKCAEEFEPTVQHAYFEVLSTYAEIGYSVGQATPTAIGYGENGFEEQLTNALRKRGFVKRVN